MDNGRRPEVVFTDKGGEFNNSLLKRELSKYHIKYFATQNEDIKNSIDERVIRTLRNKMYRLFQREGSYRYVDVVTGYNKTKHRSLNNIAPIDITKENEAIVWDKMYNVKSLSNAGNIKMVKSSNRFRRKVVSKFKINDYVRLAYTRYTFQRVYQQKWTTELFKCSNDF